MRMFSEACCSIPLGAAIAKRRGEIRQECAFIPYKTGEKSLWRLTIKKEPPLFFFSSFFLFSLCQLLSTPLYSSLFLFCPVLSPFDWPERAENQASKNESGERDKGRIISYYMTGTPFSEQAMIMIERKKKTE